MTQADNRGHAASGDKPAIGPSREVHLHLNVTPEQLAAIMRHYIGENQPQPQSYPVLRLTTGTEVGSARVPPAGEQVGLSMFKPPPTAPASSARRIEALDH
jgi:hypothetical protein